SPWPRPHGACCNRRVGPTSSTPGPGCAVCGTSGSVASVRRRTDGSARQDPLLTGPCQRAGAIVDTELPVDPLEMRTNRLVRHVQLVADAPRRRPALQSVEHLHLAVAQAQEGGG